MDDEYSWMMDNQMPKTTTEAMMLHLYPHRPTSQEKVQRVVEGKSTELDLSGSKFTHIPGGVVEKWKALAKFILCHCSSLTALPESIGQLQALTTLDLNNCSSLSADSE